MAFKAGAIFGEADLDTTKWKQGMKGLRTGAKVAMAAIAAAVTAAFIASIKAANEFQKAMANVSTLIDETQISTQALTKQLLVLDPALGSTQELTEALYQSFSAGALDAEEAMQTTVDAAKFAKAALTDTFTAVDVLTTAVNAYGRETVTTAEASDIFFQTIKLGKTTGDELASTIGSSIPLFASAGIELEELASGIATMTKQGNSAAESTTQLNAIVNAFLKPSEAMQDALQKQGFETGSAFLKTEGLAGALELVEEATDGDAGAMAELLPNIRALRGAMSLTGIGGEIFTETLEAMNDAAGSTEEAFGKQELTFATLQNSMSKVAIIAGNVGKKFLDELAVGVTAATEGLVKFLLSSQAMEFVAKLVGTVTGGFELLKVVGETIFDVYEPIVKEIFGAFADLFDELQPKQVEGVNLWRILAGVMKGWSIVATVGIRLIQLQINAFINMVRVIKEVGEVIGTFFASLIDPRKWGDIRGQAQEALEAIKNVGLGVASDVVGIFEETRDSIKGFGEETETLASNLETRVTSTFVQSGDRIRTNWDSLLTGQDDFLGAIGNGLDEFNDQFGATMDDVGNTTKEVLFDSSAEWEEYFSNIHGGFSTLVTGIVDLETQRLTNEQALLDTETQSRLAALQTQFDNEVITQEQFDAQRDAIDSQQRAKQNELGERAFDANKKSKKASIWIDTASAIVGWWRAASTMDPIGGIIFGAVMSGISVATAVAQASAIDKQQFVPAFQRGGMVSGMARINEVGGEIVTLPDNSQVIPSDISRQIGDNVSSGTTINVSFDGARIADDMDLDRVTDRVVRQLGKKMRIAS